MNFIRRIEQRNSLFQSILVTTIILIAAAYMVFTYLQASEPYGIGINSDSIAYIRSAENLLAGNGLGRMSGLGSFKPMTHWPPLYSILLAATNGIGTDLYDSAVSLGAILNFLIIILVGYLLFRLTNSAIITMFGLSLFVLAMPLWETTFRIMSEPLFLVCVFAGILSLDRFFMVQTKRWLITSGICMGLAMFTRYAAIVFIATACILLLTGLTRSKISSIKDIALYVLISCIPIGIWIGANQWLTGSATNRVFQFFPIDTKDFQLLQANSIAWFAPFQTFFDIGSGKITLFAILFGIFIFCKHFYSQDFQSAVLKQYRLVMYFLWLIPLYAVFVGISRLFFDSMIQIYRERIIFPIFLAFFLLIFYAIGQLLLVLRSKSLILSGFAILILAFSWVSFYQGYRSETGKFLAQAKSDGIGFAGLRKNPPTLVKQYQNLPQADIKLSNNIELLYMLTGEDALTLSDDFTKADIERLNQYLQDQSAVYIVFNSRKIEKHLVELNPDVSLLYQDDEGGIYRYH